MTTCRRFRVTGRVQGVFFRASTVQAAQRLDLTGWVRNAADGSVEGVVCGEPEALSRFNEWLWQGPEQARVAQVEVHDAPAADPPADFITR